MTVTIEISFYPLNNEYPATVVSFLHKLKAVIPAEVVTNGMSTLLTGSYEKLWTALGVLLQNEIESVDCVFVMKIAPGRREYVE